MSGNGRAGAKDREGKEREREKATTTVGPAVDGTAACARVAYLKRGRALTCQIGKVSCIVEHTEVTRMAH